MSSRGYLAHVVYMHTAGPFLSTLRANVTSVDIQGAGDSGRGEKMGSFTYTAAERVYVHACVSRPASLILFSEMTSSPFAYYLHESFLMRLLRTETYTNSVASSTLITVMLPLVLLVRFGGTITDIRNDATIQQRDVYKQVNR